MSDELKQLLACHSALSTHHSSLLFRYKHAQRTGAHAIVERRLDDGDLAVGGDAQASAARLDEDLAGAERVEIFRFAQATKERAQGERKQPPASRLVRHVQTEQASVEPQARADLKAVHLIDVVADEDERRAPSKLLPVHVE